MDTAQRQEALAFAAQLARAPHETIMRVFRSTTLAIETKSDGSPVTMVDRQAEAVMRHMIRAS